MNKVVIGERELLEVLQIIHTEIEVSNQNEDVDTVVFLQSIRWDIFKGLDTTDGKCELNVQDDVCMSVFNSVDSYVRFLIDTKCPSEEIQRWIDIRCLFVVSVKVD